MVLRQPEEREHLPGRPVVPGDLFFKNVSAERLGIFGERQASGVCAFEEGANSLALRIDLCLIGPLLYSSPAAKAYRIHVPSRNAAGTS